MEILHLPPSLRFGGGVQDDRFLFGDKGKKRRFAPGARQTIGLRRESPLLPPSPPGATVIPIPPERERNPPGDERNIIVVYYALSGLTSLSSNPPPAAPGVIHILPLRGLKSRLFGCPDA